MKLERLSLIALKEDDLIGALEDYQKMQLALGLKLSDSPLDEDLVYAMKVRLKKVKEDLAHYEWLTNWAIVHNEMNQIVGYIMIKGLPNALGEVIIGYGIDESYRKQGYAKEAVEGLKQWIFENPDAKAIIADTEKENVASHRVLQSLGAFNYRENDELIWWKLER
jgi:ribosomal-protein-alanine N-acetyltransferase